MASGARLRELDTRHRDLDEEIEQEGRRPGADTLHLTELKRQKLRIKEEVEALRSRMAH